MQEGWSGACRRTHSAPVALSGRVSTTPRGHRRRPWSRPALLAHRAAFVPRWLLERPSAGGYLARIRKAFPLVPALSQITSRGHRRGPSEAGFGFWARAEGQRQKKGPAGPALCSHKHLTKYVHFSTRILLSIKGGNNSFCLVLH